MESEGVRGAVALVILGIGLFITWGINLDPTPLAKSVALLVIAVTVGFFIIVFWNGAYISMVLVRLFVGVVIVALVAIALGSIYSIVVKPLRSDALGAGALGSAVLALLMLAMLRKRSG